MLPYIRLSIVTLLLCGGIYPALVVLVGGALFPSQAQGSIVYNQEGQPIGSALIGQAFDKPIYFQPRPSAAGTDGYDATASGGSNLGPTNKALVDRVTNDAKALRQANPSLTVLPADLLTTSGSGLDPDISPEAAMAQVPMVAQARGVTPDKISALVQSHVQGRMLGIFGDPRVNVLELNLALDQQFPVSGR
jgi:K+-transporting ATPase ATPase C chain